MAKKSIKVWLNEKTKKKLEKYSEKNYPYSTSGQNSNRTISEQEKNHSWVAKKWRGEGKLKKYK